MPGPTVDKSKFDNSWYKPGAKWKWALWYLTSAVFFMNPLFPFVKIKPVILRLFGAKVGKKCVIKPSVNIKFPWLLELGDYVWIGENAWIDNQAKVTIEDNATLSQGALLLTGNHNYKTQAFDLIIGEIHIGEGAWVCAKSIVGPGVRVGRNAMLSLGSRTTTDLRENGIYQGNPAQFIKDRKIEEE